MNTARRAAIDSVVTDKVVDMDEARTLLNERIQERLSSKPAFHGEAQIIQGPWYIPDAPCDV